VDEPRYCYRHPDRETRLSCAECGRPICYECMHYTPVGQRCPEHAGQPVGIRKATVPIQRAVTGVGARRVNAVTIALIAINVAVYLAELAAGGTTSGTGNWIFSHGALLVNGVTQNGNVFPVPAHSAAPGFHLVGLAHGQWWRLLTAAFLHYGPFHLAINMYSLYLGGTLLEHLIGRWRFALLYLASGVAGSAGAVLWSPNQVTLGASGAIFGVFGGLFVLERRGNIATGGQIAGLIVINLIFTFALSSFISVGGHVGGLIGGVAIMGLLTQFRRRSVFASFGVAAAVVVASVVLAYVKARGYS
jgi:membrane associated rhomboid family serine protease